MHAILCDQTNIYNSDPASFYSKLIQERHGSLIDAIISLYMYRKSHDSAVRYVQLNLS